MAYQDLVEVVLALRQQIQPQCMGGYKVIPGKITLSYDQVEHILAYIDVLQNRITTLENQDD